MPCSGAVLVKPGRGDSRPILIGWWLGLIDLPLIQIMEIAPQAI